MLRQSLRLRRWTSTSRCPTLLLFHLRITALNRASPKGPRIQNTGQGRKGRRPGFRESLSRALERHQCGPVTLALENLLPAKISSKSQGQWELQNVKSTRQIRCSFKKAKIICARIRPRIDDNLKSVGCQGGCLKRPPSTNRSPANNAEPGVIAAPQWRRGANTGQNLRQPANPTSYCSVGRQGRLSNRGQTQTVGHLLCDLRQ